jgi:hypothetical protein
MYMFTSHSPQILFTYLNGKLFLIASIGYIKKFSSLGMIVFISTYQMLMMKVNCTFNQVPVYCMLNRIHIRKNTQIIVLI